MLRALIDSLHLIYLNNSPISCISSCCKSNQTFKYQDLEEMAAKRARFDPVEAFKPDLHYFDKDIALVTGTTANAAAFLGTPIHLNNIARGDAITQRTGDHFLMTSISLKMFYNLITGGTALTRTPYFSYALVLDAKPNSASPPTFSDVFLESGETWGSCADLTLNMDKRDRLRVLATGCECIKLTDRAPTTSDTQMGSIHVERFLPLQTRVSCKGANTGALDTFTEGALYLYYRLSTLPETGAGPHQTWQMKAFVRIRFYDV